MKNKFKGYVIYSDLDGTLLNSRKEVSSENKKAIEYFIENGGKFSIATGRAFEAAEKYINGVEIDIPAIVYNGGMLYDCLEKKAVKTRYLDREKMDFVHKIKEEYDELGIEIYCGTDIYVFQDNNTAERPATLLLNISYEIPDNLFELKWNKVLLVGRTEEMDSIQEMMKEKYDVDTVRSGDRFLEILPENTSKGYALGEVIDLFNLDKSKVIAVGDDMNDAEMLQECGIAFCPENASESVKKYADVITNNNENHVIRGIVEWIEKERM
ncbi:HAD family hydrolase [uncultured Clostridium sp.]|uniref:HAD family hydrolase n=1 Tax=uncultured Clostridium sp. TaxID=59620 RepID=UPI0025E98D4E|nr:HAD family hydrolase [uncultured Clostridium sp.]